MKRFFVMFTMLTVFGASTIFANDFLDLEPRIYVKHVEGKSFKLQLANLMQKTTKVTISDLKDGLYFEAYVSKHNGYARKIILDGVNDGRYLLNVSQDGVTYSKVMVIKDGEIQFSKVSHK